LSLGTTGCNLSVGKLIIEINMSLSAYRHCLAALLIVQNRLRCGLPQFELCAHFLDLRCLLFLSCSVSASIRFSWSSTFVVFFEELVEYIAFTKSRYLRRDFICFRSMTASIAF
jgi:hypothetical protein